MAIDPSDFYEAACEINNRDDVSHRETRARITSGRAYYAAYLATRNVVRKAYDQSNHNPYHKSLSDKLKASSYPEVAKIGERLTNLRKLRVRSDYYPNETVDAKAGSLILIDAKTVLDEVESIQGQIPPGIPTH